MWAASHGELKFFIIMFLIIFVWAGWWYLTGRNNPKE